MTEYNWHDIGEYRQEEIKTAVGFVSDLMKGNCSPDYFRGAIDMFKKLLLLPKSMCNDEQTVFVEHMIATEFNQAQVDLLRNAVKE